MTVDAAIERISAWVEETDLSPDKVLDILAAAIVASINKTWEHEEGREKLAHVIWTLETMMQRHAPHNDEAEQ